MKPGDFVEQEFTNTITRRGILIQKILYGAKDPHQYWLISWLPHPDLPVKSNNLYNDISIETSLKVISSI
jgi:hypothetical protein